MVRHKPNKLSELWRKLPWKKIRRSLFRIEDIHKSVRYADDMVIILKPEDDEKQILNRIENFLAERGLRIKESKTKLVHSTEGFDFLGWHFKVQTNEKFRCVPSEDNYKAFRKKVKSIVNNSNYGARTKAEKLAPLVRGWRNYHRYCKMDGSRFSLWRTSHKAFQVFNKEKNLDRYSAKALVQKAFPSVPYSESRFVKVKGNKSPYDGDLVYWAKRNSVLYDNQTSRCLKKQNHTCGHCGLLFSNEERVHLHHIDGNHSNWKANNLLAVHESCHDYIHMSRAVKA
jgi:RNA-directed DNA polymerase